MNISVLTFDYDIIYTCSLVGLYNKQEIFRKIFFVFSYIILVVPRNASHPFAFVRL